MARMFTLRRRRDAGEATPAELADAERFEVELNLIAEQVVVEHPEWTTRQVFDESKRRMTMALN